MVHWTPRWELSIDRHRRTDYPRARVLQPVGAGRTRAGKSRTSEAFADGVRYYLLISTFR